MAQLTGIRHVGTFFFPEGLKKSELALVTLKCSNSFVFCSCAFRFSDIAGAVLKRTNLASITRGGYHTSYPGSLNPHFRSYPEYDWGELRRLFNSKATQGRDTGYPYGQKYRVIDARFVRFRTRPAMSQNLNAQLQQTKKLELFKVTNANSLFFSPSGKKSSKKGSHMTDPSDLRTRVGLE